MMQGRIWSFITVILPNLHVLLHTSSLYTCLADSAAKKYTVY